MSYANESDLKAYRKRYYQEHKEEACAREREWRKNNPEEAKRRDKEQYERHKERKKAANKKWAEDNPDKIKRISQKWRDNHREQKRAESREYSKTRTPEQRKRAWLLNRYGITQEQYEAMHEAQGGLCAICRQPEASLHPKTGKPKTLSVDHCHKTGKVRGLLCHICNFCIGAAQEDINRLQAAIDYLKTSWRRYTMSESVHDDYEKRSKGGDKAKQGQPVRKPPPKPEPKRDTKK